MSAYDFTVPSIDGSTIELDRFRGTASLVVNVASACGLAPQYAALQELYDRYADRGFNVLGVPCNQFAGQEPGSESEIVEFCTSSYAVTFPLTSKLEVNGTRRHPLYEHLTRTPDADGRAGDVLWNFEKFLVDADGAVVGRFRPFTPPDAPEVVGAIEAALETTGSRSWQPATAADVEPGDRVRLSTGMVMTVTRVEPGFLGQDGLLGLIEDSPVRWFARPLKGDVPVEIHRAA